MKKILSMVLLIVLVVTMVGCDFLGEIVGNDDQDSVVESYRNSAQRLMDVGNYEGAAEVLKEGIEQTGSEELNEMLSEVNRILQDKQEEESQLPVDATERPPAMEVPTQPPVVTQPPVTQPPQSPEVNLASVQNRINIFLSNFAEAYFSEYPCSKYNMLQFAYTHAMLNDDGEILYNSQYAYMTESTVNNILYKYFGITYGTNGAPDIYYYNNSNPNAYVSYDGDNYYYILAAGEAYASVAIASAMFRNSDGTYTVKYDVYSLADLWGDDTANYYNYTAYQAGSSSKLDYCYSGTAIVKDYTRTNGKQSYQLIQMIRE